MNQDRLNHLLAFYKEDPNDPFNIYALANEYKTFDQQKSLQYFELLARDHENYVATYYHLGLLYIDLGLEDKAKSAFEKGIEVATRQGEMLALRELKNAYDELMMDY